MSNKLTRILENDVNWYVDSKTINELDEYSIKHIEQLIHNECGQGELCISLKNGKSTYGWWYIVNWEDIALELYNSIKNSSVENRPQAQAKAIKRFDENWAKY